MPDLPRQGDRQGDYEPGPLALLLLWPLALVLIALLFPARRLTTATLTRSEPPVPGGVTPAG
jgi:uncharacterized protein (DUF58 family)